MSGIEELLDQNISVSDLKLPEVVCSRCIMPGNYPGIKFDADGVCNFCLKHTDLNDLHLKNETERKLWNLLSELKKTEDEREYDVLMAYSGGKDSTYSMWLLKEKYGLRVLAFTFDNNFISPQAMINIDNVCGILDIPHVMAKYDDRMVEDVFAHGAKNKMFSMSYMNRASTICTICSGFFKSYAIKTSLLMNIPLIGYGWSPGQSIVTTAIQKIDPKFARMSQTALSTPVIGVMGDKVIEYYLDENHYNIPMERWPTNVHPLAFEAYNEENVKEKIKVLGWRAPTDVDTNSTNCMLNAYANQQHIDMYGFHPYTSEIANMVRQGVMSREEGLIKIYSPQNKTLVDYAKNRLSL